MKKVKFYSAVALVTLSASLLTACSSTKNTIPENTFAQSTKVSTSEKKGKTTTSQTSKPNIKASKSVKSSIKEQKSDVQTVTETVSEVSQSEPLDTNTTAGNTSSEQVAMNNQVATEINQGVAQENQQVVEETVIGNQSADYSILTGTWRTANGSEIVFNDKGEVISFDGVAQDNWTPNADYAPFNHYGAWLVPYSHSYVSVLPAGVSYDDGYVVQNAVSEDRLISGTGSTDFENDQVYYRVQQ